MQKYEFPILNNVNSSKSLKTVTFRQLASFDLQDMKNDLTTHSVTRAFSAVDSIQTVEDLLTQINDALFKTLDKHVLLSHTLHCMQLSIQQLVTSELLAAK